MRQGDSAIGAGGNHCSAHCMMGRTHKAKLLLDPPSVTGPGQHPGQRGSLRLHGNPLPHIVTQGSFCWGFCSFPKNVLHVRCPQTARLCWVPHSFFICSDIWMLCLEPVPPSNTQEEFCPTSSFTQGTEIRSSHTRTEC